MAHGKRKFTPAEREQIFQLLGQGVSVSEIARLFEVDARCIGGMLSTARNRGILPGKTTDANSWKAAPAPIFAPLPAPIQSAIEPSAPVIDEWYASPTARYAIERTEPRDGHLATLEGCVDPQEIGRRYGCGRYRIRVSEGGYLVCIIIWVADDWYGPPRLPSPDEGWRSQAQEWS